MGIFRKRPARDGDGGGNPPLWDEACRFAEECRRVAQEAGGDGPVPSTARRRFYPFLSSADWRRVRCHHAVVQLLEEQGVARLEDLPLPAKRDLVGFMAPYVLPSSQLEAVAAHNPGQAERLLRDHALWQAVLTRGPARVAKGESVLAALARLHRPDPGVEAAYASGAEDLRTGAWRTGARLWFLLPYAAARDRGVAPDAAPPFRRLAAAERSAIAWMHRTLLSGSGSLDLMAEVAAHEDGESLRPGPGTALAERIYPFQAAAGDLLVEWTLPEPLPSGPRTVSRHCPFDAAFALFRVARGTGAGAPR